MFIESRARGKHLSHRYAKSFSELGNLIFAFLFPSFFGSGYRTQGLSHSKQASYHSAIFPATVFT